ncbi:hypothetical protein F5B19DRAFT_149489 [Rostrohypoxylon terebratum]|nr:hypothetical protein F5B19DRAFT_149489 [Rostrohypoxylon terebratum]
MLIRLPDPFFRASRHLPPECNMSLPPDSYARFDFRSQVIDNCEFVVSKYDVVQVIIAKVATGHFVAHAVRSNEKSRDTLICSEPRDTPQDAIESLHNKSCDAVQNYINTNGFSYPPDPKTKFDSLDSDDEADDDDRVEEVDDEDDDDADVASINSGRSASSTVALSYWGSSDDEAAAMTPASSSNPHASHEKGQQRHGHVSRPYYEYSHVGNNGSSSSSGKNAAHAANLPSKRRFKPPHVGSGVSKPREPPSPPFGPDDESADDTRFPRTHKPVPRPPKMPYGCYFESIESTTKGASNNSPPVASPVTSNTPTGNGARNVGGNAGMGKTSSYRPPPPPPGWNGTPVMVMPPPPMRGAPHVQSPPQPIGIPQPQSYAYMHSPAGGAGGQPVAAPPLPPPAVTLPAPAQPQPQTQTKPPTQQQQCPMRPTPPLQYKASMPTLGSGSPHQPMGKSPLGGLVAPPSSTRLYDVRLTIRWPGRGETKILESTRPSVRALQEMAVTYARAHASAFDSGDKRASSGGNNNNNKPGIGMVANGGGGGGIWALRACVRRAYFGPGEAYDMSAYRGDDLTKLFNVMSAGDIPRFEVEVEAMVAGVPQH